MIKKSNIIFISILQIFYVANCYAIETIKVGFGTNKPPYILERIKSGLEVEIFEKIGEVAGFKVEPIFAPMERLKLLIKDGSIDVITNTNMGENINLFNSESYIQYQNYAISLAKNNFQIKNINDLQKYSIGSFQRAKNLLGKEFFEMTEKNKNYTEYADQQQRNVMLTSERIQVVIADKRIFEYFSNDQFKKSNFDFFKIFPATNYLAGFRSINLMKKFNVGLKTIKKNGTYKKLEEKYSVLK